MSDGWRGMVDANFSKEYEKVQSAVGFLHFHAGAGGGLGADREQPNEAGVCGQFG